MILIVDDSLTVRKDLEEAFRDAGYAPICCASIAEAKRALVDARPDLVILDVLLPDGDGIDLLAELRRGATTASVPVMLLSGEAEVKDRIRGLSTGADEYVGKPYDSNYVVARAQTLLARRHDDASPQILVIDDSLTFREAIADSLRSAGYRIGLAASGEEGLRQAAALRPDAIIVDGVMPDLDGATVVRRLRLDSALSATPCLLLTAAEGAGTEVVALDAGVDAYVRKTEDIGAVLARLGALLRTAEASRVRPHTTSLLGPKRILAVDDSRTYLETLAEELRRDGHEVVKASSGEEALALLEVEPVDAIILDVVMPGLSGNETCRRIKESETLRRIPLIMLTSREEHEAMIEGINAGADDYVTKASDFDVLRARLRAQLRRRQFEDENRRVRDELLRAEAETLAARQLADARQQHLQILSQKNVELERLTEELRTFAYSVSHDLRQPLRAMDGFSRILLEDYAAALDARGKDLLSRMGAGAERMSELIDGLLRLSRVAQKELRTVKLRVDRIAETIVGRLRDGDPQRVVKVDIQAELDAEGDPQLFESLLENLIGNAWKFTSKTQGARIAIAARHEGQERAYYVRDNGAGFDMKLAHKLFGPFQRLHSASDFEGTGIGLATVQRIVRRHGGRVWAESQPGSGATFFFTMAGEPPSGAS